MTATRAGPADGRQASGWAERVRRRRPPHDAVALALLALVVILPGLHWGIPHATAPDRVHAWGNDDLVPLAPLAEMHNTFIEAKPDRNVAYPWGHHALVAAAYAPYLAYLMASDGVRNPTGVYPFGLAEPARALRTLSWIGRTVSVLFGLATVLGTWYAARVLWGGTAGVAAGAFTLLLFPLAYYARVGNPDIAALGWTSLALAVAARCVRDGLVPRLGVWLGILVAMAGASKDQALASFVLVGPALTALHVARTWRGAGAWPTLKGPLVALAAFVGASVLAHGILIDPARWAAHVDLLTAGGSSSYLRYPATASGYLANLVDLTTHLAQVMSWPGLLAAAVGLSLAARRDRASLLLALAAISFFALLVPVRFSRIHYLLPVAVPLCLWGGYAVAAGLAAGHAGLRRATAVAAAAVAVFLALRVADLTHDMIRDSRYAAGDWLAARIGPGDRIGYFGPSLRLPWLPAAVTSIGAEVPEDVRVLLEDTRPEFLVIVPDDTNFERQRVEWRSGLHSVLPPYLSPSRFDSLTSGALGYRPVARFQTARLMPWLPRPFLSYPTVNPPIHVFARDDRLPDAPRVEPWDEARHYPAVGRVDRLTVDYRRSP